MILLISLLVINGSFFISGVGIYCLKTGHHQTCGGGPIHTYLIFILSTILAFGTAFNLLTYYLPRQPRRQRLYSCWVQA